MRQDLGLGKMRKNKASKTLDIASCGLKLFALVYQRLFIYMYVLNNEYNFIYLCIYFPLAKSTGQETHKPVIYLIVVSQRIKLKN